MRRDKQKAFSFAELLVAMTILAILISLAIPAFARFQESKRQESVKNLLINHLQHTRTQAITKGRPHQLCGSSDGETCDGGWTNYWLVTTTSNPPSVISQHASPTQKLCWVGFGSDNVYIRFHPNGTSYASNGTFYICNVSGTHWTLVLNRQGRLKQETSDSANCC